MQEATYGERTTERMSIATWIVCRLVITEYTIILQQHFPFAKKLTEHRLTVD